MAYPSWCPVEDQEARDGCHPKGSRKGNPSILETEKEMPLHPRLHVSHTLTPRPTEAPRLCHFRLPDHLLLCNWMSR